MRSLARLVRRREPRPSPSRLDDVRRAVAARRPLPTARLAAVTRLGRRPDEARGPRVRRPAARAGRSSTGSSRRHAAPTAPRTSSAGRSSSSRTGSGSARSPTSAPYAGHLAGAAAAIALVTPDPRDAGQPLSVMWDLGGAAAQMMLVAWELGIGSCPATVYEQDAARELLGLSRRTCGASTSCRSATRRTRPSSPRPPRARRPAAAGRGRPPGALGRLTRARA